MSRLQIRSLQFLFSLVFFLLSCPGHAPALTPYEPLYSEISTLQSKGQRTLWHKLTATKGCTINFYSSGLGFNNPSHPLERVNWSGECEAGRPASGTGWLSLEFRGGAGRRFHATMKDGFMHGEVRQPTATSTKFSELAVHTLDMGCSPDQKACNDGKPFVIQARGQPVVVLIENGRPVRAVSAAERGAASTPSSPPVSPDVPASTPAATPAQKTVAGAAGKPGAKSNRAADEELIRNANLDEFEAIFHAIRLGYYIDFRDLHRISEEILRRFQSHPSAQWAKTHFDAVEQQMKLPNGKRSYGDRGKGMALDFAKVATRQSGGTSFLASSATSRQEASLKPGGKKSAPPAESGKPDSSKQRKVHNPAADAKSCVQLAQVTNKNDGIRPNWMFTNGCNSAVEIFWCFPDGKGGCGRGGTWTVQAGGNWPAFGTGQIKWGACRGRDGGGMVRGSGGDRYTCHLLEW